MFWGEGLHRYDPPWSSFWANTHPYCGLSLEAATSAIPTVEPSHSRCARGGATVADSGKHDQGPFTVHNYCLESQSQHTLSQNFEDKGVPPVPWLMASRQTYSTALWHNKRAKPLLKSCKNTWRQIFTAPRQGWTLRMWGVKSLCHFLWLKPSSDFWRKHHE